MSPAANDFESRIRDLLPDLESLYTDIPAHAELSMQETRTAGVAAIERIVKVPVLHPTLETGVATLVVALRAWLAR